MNARTFLQQTRARLAAAESRRGAILVLFMAVLIMVLIFTAFTVDIGYIVVTKSELQKSSDASALSAMIELQQSLGPGANISQSQAESQARQAAVDVAALNRAGGLPSVTADPNQDVRFGQVTWDPNTSSWTKTWGTGPYNMVEVTLRRIEASGGVANDGPLPLFFGKAANKSTADVAAKATVAVFPALGFRVLPGSPGNAEILPIALDEGTWNAMLAGGGDDDFSWNEATKTISNGSDGIREIDLYPSGSNLMPPGNRGTVDFGHSGNSTQDIKRQILYGLNSSDMAYLGGQINFDNGPMIINGDTGISAGIAAELNAIKGQPRAIPIFTTVSGPGNNAQYTVIKLVGIRILKVKLTGGNKYVIVQPAPVYSQNAIPGGGTITTGSVMTKPMLIQ